MSTKSRASGSTRYIKIQVRPFVENGVTFAECPEMRLVASGDSESEAVINLLNMVNASLAMAEHEGNLSAVLKQAGIRSHAALPDTEASPSSNILNYTLPVPTNAGSRAVG